MAEETYGDPFYFYDQHAYPEDDTHMQRARDEDARYGASLKNSYVQPTFFSCHQLLQIAAFIQANHAWIHEHALRNEEQSASLVSGVVYVRLQHLDNPENHITLSFFKEDRDAYYGTPVQAGAREWHAYPKDQWIECAERKPIE